MKNQFMLKSLKFALAFVFILFVSSCSDDTDVLNITEDDSSLQIISANKEGQLAAKPYDESVDCNADCIEIGSDDYFEKDNEQTVNWGGPNNDKFSKTIDINYYNTETEFVLKVKSTNGWSDLVIDDVSSWTDGPVEADEWGTYSFPLEEGWQACDIIDFRLQVTGNGPQAVFDVSYSLIGVCGGCIESKASTAYAGDGTGVTVTQSGGNNSWWFYFDIGNGEANITQEIWESKSNDIGDVAYNAINKKITITLNNDWFLETGEDESVKWYSYAYNFLPTNGRPIPGKANNKGTSLIFPTVDGDRYYVIHLDVATCLE